MIERRTLLKWCGACVAAAAASPIMSLSGPAISTLEARPAVEPDEFGGNGVVVGEATGVFRVAKIGSRWLFVTPKGQGFFMTGVYSVVFSEAALVKAKYGDAQTWAQYTGKRLKSWGFNTLAEYYHRTLERERLPFVTIVKPAGNAMMQRWGLGSKPVKDLMALPDSKVYRGWRGRTPDVWDPAFEEYVDAFLRKALLDSTARSVIGSPWLLGITADDADYLFGYGPGPEFPAHVMHPHLGWIVLIGNFERRQDDVVYGHKVHYADPTVYSKLALRDFLKAKYRTIDALNVAWRSTYTTFDSAGGWQQGTGLLDESGHNAWVGRWREDDEPVGLEAGVRSDLDAFLYEHAKKFFSVITSKIRLYAPRHLVFGPAALNGWGGLTRRPILKAAGEVVDVVQVRLPDPELFEATTRAVGDKALVTWDAFSATPDSSHFAHPQKKYKRLVSFATQEERGRGYAQRLEFLVNAKTARGDHPVAGIKLWAYKDYAREKVNFGLVSQKENAYDGREAVTKPGKDAWGFPTGGEERDYGDFLSKVREANLRAADVIRKEVEQRP